MQRDHLGTVAGFIRAFFFLLVDKMMKLNIHDGQGWE
jgi:hypothetical protein